MRLLVDKLEHLLRQRLTDMLAPVNLPPPLHSLARGSSFSAKASVLKIGQATVVPGTTDCPFGWSTRFPGNPSALTRFLETRPVFNGTAQPEGLGAPVFVPQSYDQDFAAATSLRRFAPESGGASRGKRSHWVGHTEDQLLERKPRDRLFPRAVDYRTYRLRLTGNGHFDPQEADGLSDIQGQDEGVMTANKFAGRDPILVLNVFVRTEGRLR